MAFPTPLKLAVNIRIGLVERSIALGLAVLHNRGRDEPVAVVVIADHFRKFLVAEEEEDTDG